MRGTLYLQRAGQCALHAYDDDGQTFIDMGYTNVSRVQAGVAAGWLASCPDHAILATAGTVGPRTQPRNILDWLSHVDFQQLDIGGGIRVHRAWYPQAVAYLPAVLTELGNQGVTSLMLVGHSYGGALSLLLAPQLADNGITVTDVYTFGCPRVGNAAFETILPTSEVFRVERGLDPVVWVPFSTPLWLLGLQWAAYLKSGLYIPHGPVFVDYAPAGDLVWCDDQVVKPRLIDNPVDEAFLRLRRLADLGGSFSRPVSSLQAAGDHSIEAYASHVASQRGV